MSQFTIDVIDLAIKQGRAVTNSTMFSLAIAEKLLNKRELDKKSYDAAVEFAASMQPPLLDEWVRVCYANERPLSQALVQACRRRITPRHTTADFEASYKDLLLMQSTGDLKGLSTQELILENLVAETYELLKKEKA